MTALDEDADDEKWLNELAGRRPDALANNLSEARTLRAFLRALPEEDGSAVLPNDVEREQALIARARATGLLPPPTESGRRGARSDTAAGAQRWWQALFAPRVGLAAAALAVLAIIGVPTLFLSPGEIVSEPVGVPVGETVGETVGQPVGQTHRGAEHAVVRLEAEDPQALQRQLRDELAAFGVRVIAYEQLGRASIDADLTLPVSLEVRQVLVRHGIPVPADGALLVEIVVPRAR